MSVSFRCSLCGADLTRSTAGSLGGAMRLHRATAHPDYRGKITFMPADVAPAAGMKQVKMELFSGRGDAGAIAGALRDVAEVIQRDGGGYKFQVTRLTPRPIQPAPAPSSKTP